MAQLTSIMEWQWKCQTILNEHVRIGPKLTSLVILNLLVLLESTADPRTEDISLSILVVNLID